MLIVPSLLAFGLTVVPLPGARSVVRPAAARADVVPAGGEYLPLTPARVLDTRTGTGGVTGPLAGGATISVTVLGQGGVPSSGVSAVALDVTSLDSTTNSWLTVWAAGQPRPNLATLGTSVQGPMNNLAMVQPGSGGQVSVYNSSGSDQVVLDAIGYVTAPGTGAAGGTYVPVSPVRAFDTRDGTGSGFVGPLGSGATISEPVAGVGGVPATGVASVAINIAATGTSTDSALTVWAAGQPQPSLASMTTLAEGSVEHFQVVPVGTGGKISIWNKSGSTQVIGDIAGYFLDPATTGAGAVYVPLTPTRIMDTRTGLGGVSAPLGAGAQASLAVLGAGGIPASRVSSVALNVASLDATGGSYLTAWADGTARPNVSTLQVRSGISQSDLVFVQPGTNGKIDFYNAAYSTDLVVDVVGYFSTNHPPALDRRSQLPGDGAQTGTATPTLHTTYTDPDGDTGQVAFEVYSGSTLVASDTSGTVASGTDVTWTVPAGTLADGATYSWRSRAIDADGAASGWSTKLFNTEPPSITGDQRRFTYETRQLSDRAQMKVNVANGNLLLHSTDLQIRGTGIDFTLDRYYNSRSTATSALGVGWTVGIGQDVRLNLDATNPTTSDVTYVAPSRFSARFDYDPTGASPGGTPWHHPPGVDADLSYNAGDTYPWTLKFQQTEGKYLFDANGVFQEEVDRNNNKISFGYNASGLVSTVTDTQNRVTSFAYSNGRLATVTDPIGRTLSYSYDNQNNLQTFTDAAGNVIRYQYDGDLLSQVTTGGGSITQFSYDGSRRMISDSTQYDPGNGIPTPALTSFDYESGQTKVTDPNGNNTTSDSTDGITTYQYDDRDRVTKVIDALGHSQGKSYTSNDNITTLTDGLQQQTTLGWDPNDENLTSVSLPTGAKSSLDYTDGSHPHSVTKTTDPQGNTMSYTYDSPGNRHTSTSSQYPATALETVDHNSDGTVSKITEGDGDVTSFSYDGNGNLTGIDYPTPLGNVTYSPDALSRLHSEVDGKGQTNTFGYDALDHTIQTTFNDGSSVVDDYDPDGNLTETDDPTGITKFAYDKMNRQTRKTLPSNQQLRYGYDHNGNLTSYTDAGGTISYGYNQVNLLTSLAEPGGDCTTSPVTNPCTRFSYDENNRRTETDYPTSPATAVKIGYDHSGRETSVTATAGSSTLASYTYSYSSGGADTGLRQSVTDLGGTTSYSYDGLDRLIGASGELTRSYGYDIDSNRTSKTISGTATSYAYNAANELTTINGANAYSYDGDGNTTGGGGGWSFSYNAANQTTSITKPGGSTLSPLAYAGTDQNERVQAGTTSYVTSALGVSSATTGSATTYYTRDNQGNLVSLRTSAGSYYYLFDGLGSVIGLVDGTGAKIDSYSYDPYGEQLSASETVTNPWRYAAGQYDTSTGLTKFGIRYYDPTEAHFTQPDPTGKDLPYAYAGDDPVDNTDRTGKQQDTCAEYNASCASNPDAPTGGAAPDAAAEACIEGGIAGAVMVTLKVSVIWSPVGAIAGCGIGILAVELGLPAWVPHVFVEAFDEAMTELL